MDAATVQRRVDTMRSLLDDLRSVGDVTPMRLETDRMLRHGIERVLSQLVELAVAINGHVGSVLSGRAPVDYRSSFAAAAAVGLIDDGLAARLAPAVGLRNILVHDYVTIDLRVVADSVAAALEDFADYCGQVGVWLVGIDDGNSSGSGSTAGASS